MLAEVLAAQDAAQRGTEENDEEDSRRSQRQRDITTVCILRELRTGRQDIYAHETSESSAEATDEAQRRRRASVVAAPTSSVT